MDRKHWAKVKPGDLVIYADEYEGVHKAKILETDIRLQEPGPPSVWSYPYGKTAETGTVKIQYDSTEVILNLAQLAVYKVATLATLERSWVAWKAQEKSAGVLRQRFLELAAEEAEK